MEEEIPGLKEKVLNSNKTYRYNYIYFMSKYEWKLVYTICKKPAFDLFHFTNSLLLDFTFFF